MSPLLLEHLDEAKAKVDLLRLQLLQWKLLHEKITHLLNVMGRYNGQAENLAGEARILVEKDFIAIQHAMELGNLLQLDNDLFAATDRLKALLSTAAVRSKSTH